MSLTDDTLFDPNLAVEAGSPVAIAAPRGVGAATIALIPRHGGTRRSVGVRYQLVGAAGAPVVAVLGGISASRHVAAHDGTPGWWDDQVGERRAIDLARYRVLSFDWLTAADLGEVAAVASEDQADALAALLGALGIARLHALVGSSYGAMVGLAFAARHPHRLRRLVAISGAHRAHPLATALRHLQREIVRDGLASGDPSRALSLARQLAMTTYRGAQEFAERFDEEPERREDGRFHFAVADYLECAGAKFVARFDARRFLELSESIDLHRIDPRAVRIPATLVGVTSDRLVPIEDLRALAAALPDATLVEIDSRYGHDAFLKETGAIAAAIRPALDRQG